MNSQEENDIKQAMEIDKKETTWLEEKFENIMWGSRFAVILAVIASLCASLVLFLIGSVDIFSVFKATFDYYIMGDHSHDLHSTAVGIIIGAIDLYLIAIVLFIFSFGVYELFISKIDIAAHHGASKILEIHSLDQLKDKISKVIIMVLVVRYFQMVLDMSFSGPLEMLYLALSILALSLGLYFLHKGGSH